MTSPDPGTEAPLLMTPGPSRVPEPVRRAGSGPMLHHREPEFSVHLAGMIEGLRPVFGAAGDVLLLHTSGRGALEAAICNLLSPGDLIVSCCNGKFGEMWAGFAESYGVEVERVCTDWTRSVDPSEVEAALADRPEAAAVTVVHSDTSTGVLNDVGAVARVAREAGALTLVDCISSLGGAPVRFDDRGLDVAVGASQKGLMSSAGLSFVAVSDEAWTAAERSTLPRNYLDLAAVKEYLARPHAQTPGSTPVHPVLQVEAALRMIHDEGVEAVFERHRTMARICREGLADLGFGPLCPELEELSPTLTAVRVPAELDAAELRRRMKEQGILVAGGLGEFRGRALRIGHMGDIRPADVRWTVDALDSVVSELGGGGR